MIVNDEMKVVFVFTNYNNSVLTLNAISSITQMEGSKDNVTVVVVDNCSAIKEREILNKIDIKDGLVSIIFSKENVGYFPGLNLGIKYARENFPVFNYMVIGNNDVLFPKSFLMDLRQKRALFSKYPVVSPNIITLDGQHQNPHVVKSISKKREFVYDLYYANYLLAKFISSMAKLTSAFTDRKDELQHEVSQEIGQGYGACYILGPLFFENFEKLWAPTFLTYEEFFLSRQLADKFFKVFYESSIRMTHLLHATTKTIPAKRGWQFAREAHRIYRRYVKVWGKNL